MLSLFIATAALVVAPPTSSYTQTRQSSPPQQATHVLTDSSYVPMMEMHHQEGIKMAQLAVTKASDARVKDLASRIVTMQQTEIKELEALKSKVKADPNPKEHEGMMKPMPMDHLEKSEGAAFDRMFLDMMIQHHQDAIKMSKAAKLTAADVQGFAKKTTAQQEKDIKEMQALRKQVK